jgi:transcriptional regulator with XRE-family HTH domain
MFDMAKNSMLVRIFCRNLHDIRVSRGLTQTKAAAMIGIGQPQYACMESGKNAPTLETIEKIAIALNIPVLDLLQAEPAQRVSA